MNATTIINVECVVIAIFAVGIVLLLLIRFFKRNGRPELALGQPIALAYLLRLIAVAGVSATGLGAKLRGGDELGFVYNAHQIAATPFSSGLWLPGSPTRTQPIEHKLYELVMAGQIKLFGFPTGALRVTQVGISLIGFILIVVAVYDLAGPRAARLSAWLLAIEPANIFFNGLLHKEPLMELATGLVVLGGAKIWRGLNPAGILLMAAGAGVALATRPYVSWLLAAAAVLIVFHSALRQLGSLRSIPAIYGVVAAIFIATPAILQATTPQSLNANLQSSQNANTQVAASAPGTSASQNGNNLALESVNYSTRLGIITNLPQRMSDVLLRPFPWQLGDTGQQLGLLGSIFALGGLWLLIRYAWQSRGSVFSRAGPLIYPGLFMLFAYALSVGNAGTGFRYRTELVSIGLPIVVLLGAHLRGKAAEAVPHERGIVRPLAAGSVGVGADGQFGWAELPTG